MQLGGENKIRVDRCCLPTPEPSQFWTNVSVKRSIDLNDVEEPSQEFNGMNFLARYFGWVEDSVPVLIRPASSSNADSRRGIHRTAGQMPQISTSAERKLRPVWGGHSCPPMPRIPVSLSLALGRRQHFDELMSKILDYVQAPSTPERRHARNVEIGVQQVLPMRWGLHQRLKGFFNAPMISNVFSGGIDRQPGVVQPWHQGTLAFELM